MTSHTTQGHEDIRRWVEAHGGKPATFPSSPPGDEAGVLGVDVPDGGGEDKLFGIRSTPRFDTLDHEELGYRYRSDEDDGNARTAFKLVSR